MIRKKWAKQTGFTLVELLIVIVVIAILAAISIVAYNGIQNRANDTTIKSDLSNFAKQVQLYAADNGSYPEGGSSYASITNAPAVGVVFKASRSAYHTGVHNLSYCYGTLAGEKVWAISARSKSGNVFLYRQGSGIIERGNIGHTSTSACLSMDTDRTYSYGYNYNLDSWFDWTE